MSGSYTDEELDGIQEYQCDNKASMPCGGGPVYYAARLGEASLSLANLMNI